LEKSGFFFDGAHSLEKSGKIMEPTLWRRVVKFLQALLQKDRKIFAGSIFAGPIFAGSSPKRKLWSPPPYIKKVFYVWPTIH